MFKINGQSTSASVYAEQVEEECIKQIISTCNNPAFTNPIVIMPDCHAGKGSVVGFTTKITDKVIPQTIGVDIGCGMMSVNIGNQFNLETYLKDIDHEIRRAIPMGFNIHKNAKDASANSTKDKQQFIKRTLAVAKKIGYPEEKILLSIGSLGGGNHFVEIGMDLHKCYWITIHSGSRGFGLSVCNYWQKIANDNKGYLGTINMDDYLQDMYVAQKYASINRNTMMYNILRGLRRLISPSMDILETIEAVHNYIDPTDNILRKGACRSYVGEKIIIPFNMRDGILICEGKSNSDWNYSAPHGAGRVLSRSKAKKQLSLYDFKKQMEGIFSTSVTASTLDEAPDAYKDARIIEKLIEPTAKVINRIKPVLNMKAV